MESQLTQTCLSILKRDDVKNELKNLMSPIVDMVLSIIYPYLYLSLIFICISFLLHLGIFTLLIRNKYFFTKIP
jgi:hypothetical protein